MVEYSHLININNIHNKTINFENQLTIKNSLTIKNCNKLKIYITSKINKITIENSNEIFIQG